jgi:hypothetical protein
MVADKYAVFAGDGSVSLGSTADRVVYPEWWGTDDTLAIDKAIGSISTGTVSFAAREYTVSGQININKSGIRLIGQGRESTVLSTTVGFPDDYVVSCEDASWIYEFELGHMGFDCDNASPASGIIYTRYINNFASLHDLQAENFTTRLFDIDSNSNQIHISNVHSIHKKPATTESVRVFDCNEVSFSNVTVHGNSTPSAGYSNYEPYVFENVSNFALTSTYAGNYDLPLTMKSCEDGTFANVVFEGGNSPGVRTGILLTRSGPAQINTRRVRILQASVDSTADDEIKLDYANNCIVDLPAGAFVVSLTPNSSYNVINADPEVGSGSITDSGANNTLSGGFKLMAISFYRENLGANADVFMNLTPSTYGTRLPAQGYLTYLSAAVNGTIDAGTLDVDVYVDSIKQDMGIQFVTSGVTYDVTTSGIYSLPVAAESSIQMKAKTVGVSPAGSLDTWAVLGVMVAV